MGGTRIALHPLVLALVLCLVRFQFVLVRNPFTRISSTYLNKLVYTDAPDRTEGWGTRKFWNKVRCAPAPFPPTQPANRPPNHLQSALNIAVPTWGHFIMLLELS